MARTKHTVCKASKKHYVFVPDFGTVVMKKRRFPSGNVERKVYPKSTEPPKNSGVERVMELVKAFTLNE